MANDGNDTGVEEESTPTLAYLEKLQEVRQQLDSGMAPSVTVRQFLDWFGNARRGRWVVRQIRDALHEAQLHTDPDFEYAFIDSPIVFLKSLVDPHPSPVTTTNHALSEVPSNEPVVETPQSTVNALPVPKVYVDPTYRIGKLPFANRPPVSIHPDRELTEALTVMLQHDYSQLPVMTNERELRGMISWKSMAVRSCLTSSCRSVKDCMGDPPETVTDDTSLFKVIDKVVEHECVLVRDKTRKVIGIVTASDLSETFHQLGRPFLLLGEIENLIRGLLENKFTLDQLQAVRVSDDVGRQVKDISDLTFGEYVRLIQDPERWNRIGLKIDRTAFVKDLERVNRIRNDVMHFDPEGITPDELDQLSKTKKFLQVVRTIHDAI